MSYVLIIEPDLLLAKTLSSFLKNKGMRSKVCAEASEAMRLADLKKPRAIIMELQLPKFSAIEFLYEFRSYQDWQNVPVIICGIVPPEEVGFDSPTWKQLGVLGYEYKPKMKLENIVSEIKFALANK